MYRQNENRKQKQNRREEIRTGCMDLKKITSKQDKTTIPYDILTIKQLVSIKYFNSTRGIP